MLKTRKEMEECYEFDEIEKGTIKNIYNLVDEKARIGAVNEITENLRDDMRKQKQITKEEQEEDKIL